MLDELRDLYQEVILDHGRNPRNFRRLDPADREAEGYNPLCGDRVTIYLLIRDDVVDDVAFEGSGCAISTAAASMMTQGLKGKSVDEARDLFERFHGLVAGDEEGDRLVSQKLSRYALAALLVSCAEQLAKHIIVGGSGGLTAFQMAIHRVVENI